MLFRSERAYKDLKSKGLKHEVRILSRLQAHVADILRFMLQRVVLLEIWKAFEEKYGTAEDVVKVQGMMPITSKRRIVDKETGQTVEDWDIVFADDERESNPTSFKFLQMAHAWKAMQAKAGGAAGAGGPAPLSGFVATAAASSSSSAASAEKEKDAAEEEEDRRDRMDDASSDVASSNGGDD